MCLAMLAHLMLNLTNFIANSVVMHLKVLVSIVLSTRLVIIVSALVSMT